MNCKILHTESNGNLILFCETAKSEDKKVETKATNTSVPIQTEKNVNKIGKIKTNHCKKKHEI